MKRRRANRESLASDLARLPDLDRPALVEQWRRCYETEPPFKISRQLLIQAIAYRLQEQVLGGLNPATQRFLAKVAEEAAMGKKTTALPQAVKPGTRLLREWHGVTHEVIVLESGVQFGDKQYRSLSQVARTITGTRWSGPLFFGLKQQRDSRDHAVDAVPLLVSDRDHATDTVPSPNGAEVRTYGTRDLTQGDAA